MVVTSAARKAGALQNPAYRPAGTCVHWGDCGAITTACAQSAPTKPFLNIKELISTRGQFDLLATGEAPFPRSERKPMLAHDSVSGGTLGCPFLAAPRRDMTREVRTERHVPVLLDEALDALGVRSNGRYIDATFGAGGYSRAMLASHDDMTSWRSIATPSAIRDGADLVERPHGRLRLVQARFGDIAAWPRRGLRRNRRHRVRHRRVLDAARPGRARLFVSSGWSARHAHVPDGLSAADIVNSYSVQRLADLLRHLGEERFAGPIARAIVGRGRRPDRTTLDCNGSLPPPCRGPRRHDPATRTFQALRIAVNDELDELMRGLIGAATSRPRRPARRRRPSIPSKTVS